METMKQHVTFSLIEEGGYHNFAHETYDISLSEEECLTKYIVMRKIQSIKGFKTPEPIEVKIENIQIYKI